MIYDIAVIGGGLVGLATALALVQRGVTSLIVLEAEDDIAAHQSGHNSGVIHSGLYYKPGSLKASLCIQGREELYAFCAEHAIRYDRCGKLVVATRPEELPRLDALEARGRANGLAVQRLRAAELSHYEPHVTGLAGLWVPETGIVDYRAVAKAYELQIQLAGGRVRTRWKLLNVLRDPDRLILESALDTVECHNLIVCGGLQADRLARLCGVDPGIRVVPFRGEYYELTAERRGLIKNLVYPVPDPHFPFLGVHFTRKIEGGVEAGPNAVLALKREGYGKFSFNSGDAWDTLAYGGFWGLARRHWRMGMGEIARSTSKYAFWRALQRLVPDLEVDDLTPAGAGVRAQALDPQGRLLDDFHIVGAYRMIHVLNAPSPAATASLAIGRYIAEEAVKSFELRRE